MLSRQERANAYKAKFNAKKAVEDLQSGDRVVGPGGVHINIVDRIHKYPNGIGIKFSDVPGERWVSDGAKVEVF